MIGRLKETSTLQAAYDSNKSEFVAVYGRRRVGKTFLIRTVFEQQINFYVTGIGNTTKVHQLANFHQALQNLDATIPNKVPEDWFDAFRQLIKFIEKTKSDRKVIFIDELPWFDTKNANFIQALEHFWNSWASARKDIVLIVCGSSASWMINKLINNKGGLHNRITKRIKVSPFTLHECELFLQSKESALEKYQIVQLYMVLGGIPFYWEEVKINHSAAQNIEEICFSENGLLRNEFLNLFSSLFSNSDRHLSIVNALATKAKGLTRDDILGITKLANAGSTSRLLEELEESGFIRKYVPFGKKTKNSLYQLVDFYTLFYLKFISQSQILDENNWINAIDNPQYRAWSGYAFEQVCLYHLAEIKKTLSIQTIQTASSSWRSENAKENGAQIDLVIDRRDQVINLCEMKFSINPYVIDKKYAEELRNKVGAFKQETKTKKTLFLTLITSFGIQKNSHSIGLVQNELTMEDLFIQ